MSFTSPNIYSKLLLEIGATSTAARHEKNKKQNICTKHILKVDRNELMKKIFMQEYDKEKTTWIKNLKVCMQKTKLTL